VELVPVSLELVPVSLELVPVPQRVLVSRLVSLVPSCRLCSVKMIPLALATEVWLKTSSLTVTSFQEILECIKFVL